MSSLDGFNSWWVAPGSQFPNGISVPAASGGRVHCNTCAPAEGANAAARDTFSALATPNSFTHSAFGRWVIRVLGVVRYQRANDGPARVLDGAC